jgi:periplasmic divalent cation tolerance protein
MIQPENDFVVVFCTAPQGEAESLAKTLVKERLAACVNISPVRSCYTKKSRFEPLKDRILMLHSYAIPEIIALPIVAGHQPYLDWMSQPD